MPPACSEGGCAGRWPAGSREGYLCLGRSSLPARSACGHFQVIGGYDGRSCVHILLESKNVGTTLALIQFLSVTTAQQTLL